MNKEIVLFINEMKRSDWYDLVPFQQRKYNDMRIQESEQSYYKKVEDMYFAAVIALISMPTEKYGILLELLEEVETTQECFEMPSDELLNSLINQSNNQVRGLKEDYDYLCFVRNCMRIQKSFLGNFKKKISSSRQNESDKIEKQNTILTITTNQNELIKGVKGLAAYLKISVTKAQDVINSNILQNNGIAYRAGNGWNFNSQKLEELLSKQPSILYKRNK